MGKGEGGPGAPSSYMASRRDQGDKINPGVVLGGWVGPGARRPRCCAYLLLLARFAAARTVFFARRNLLARCLDLSITLAVAAD